jgi:hypothetical protein
MVWKRGDGVDQTDHHAMVWQLGRRRDACPRSACVQTKETRCKRRDGAWARETCGCDERTHRRWEGGKWRRCFCGFEAPGWSPRSAKTVTPRGAAIYTRWTAPRACELRFVATVAVQTRDGWAVGETQKRTGHHRDEFAPSAKRPTAAPDVEEEHRQLREREAEATMTARF